LSKGLTIVKEVLAQQGMQPFPFQEESWAAIANNKHGLVNAPTGCGKTFAVFLGAIINHINNNPTNYTTQKNWGLQLLWVTPLRALAASIAQAMEQILAALQIPWQVAIRNGDTSTTDRQKQKRTAPEILVITPESLHLLIATKDNINFFKTLQIIAIDEWHDVMGSKRGVMVELAIAYLIKQCNTKLLIWGISATIGNMQQAATVLWQAANNNGAFIKANFNKRIQVESIIPQDIERYPWAGHLGIKLLPEILPIINNSNTTLLFINTRGMSEIWYQAILDYCPELAGQMALHHGSIEKELRVWVEDALHKGTLKLVVCTASLDLGVDFRPVETVIQVGSPKGVSRFLQRAGRSGHSPFEVSKIYFLPTHTLELCEAAALKQSIVENNIEARPAQILCYDVLIQFLCTLACGDGFEANNAFELVQQTFCFKEITRAEFNECIQFVVHGGNSLQEYDEYRKVEFTNGIYKINSRKIAMRHRMHIGTIVSDSMLKVKLLSGGFIGVIEEYFISKLNPRDVFTLAGRKLEFVGIKEMTVQVKKSTAKKSLLPSWAGGRMPLTSNLSEALRIEISKAAQQQFNNSKELAALQPLFALQEQLSTVPKYNELLIELIETKDGYHLFCYPFEGRQVNQILAGLLAYRISKITPITFSIAENDYGFELLSDQPIPVDDSNVYELFTSENLIEDIQRGINTTEMAKRKFRDIAVIGGLIFQGYPNAFKKARHLQASASLIFKVFHEYEKDHMLMRQAYNEVFDQQVEEFRLREALHRMQTSKIIITVPQKLTPFCFPIKVDSMRETLSSEKLEDRVKKMIAQL
jgi:ATP-dependent helicase Lhr and Lhr-like helicase